MRDLETIDLDLLDHVTGGCNQGQAQPPADPPAATTVDAVLGGGRPPGVGMIGHFHADHVPARQGGLGSLVCGVAPPGEGAGTAAAAADTAPGDLGAHADLAPSAAAAFEPADTAHADLAPTAAATFEPAGPAHADLAPTAAATFEPAGTAHADLAPTAAATFEPAGTAHAVAGGGVLANVELDALPTSFDVPTPLGNLHVGWQAGELSVSIG